MKSLNSLVMQLTELQPRDDYQEVLELAFNFFRHNSSHGVHFSAPGAMHHACWMAKIIYSFQGLYVSVSVQTNIKREARTEKSLHFLCNSVC